jgi:excisionase family DNA binding protein
VSALSTRPKPDRVWLSVKEASQRIGTSEKIVYQACRRHELRHTRLSNSPFGKLRIRIDWLENWMSRLAVGGDRS